MFNGNRLDWCVNWSEDCGKPAADAFCRNLGFRNASSFAPDLHIGWRTPTRLIGTGATCDLAHCDGFKHITCVRQPVSSRPAGPAIGIPRNRPAAADGDRNEKKTAATAPMSLAPDVAPPRPGATAVPAAAADEGKPARDTAVTKQFEKPMYNSRRLSWCHGFIDGCGKPAADAFCKLNGFARASGFAPDPHIGDVEPTRSMANGAVCDQAPCDGFKTITCAM